MGLFGSHTPKGDDPIWFPKKVMEDAQALIQTRNVRVGYERELGTRLMPYKDMLKRVELAYEITAYPVLKRYRPGAHFSIYEKLRDFYGIETKEKILDAIEHPGEAVEENPHRAPIELAFAERKLLGIITKARGLPYDYEKRAYRYADLPKPWDGKSVIPSVRKQIEDAIRSKKRG